MKKNKPLNNSGRELEMCWIPMVLILFSLLIALSLLAPFTFLEQLPVFSALLFHTSLSSLDLLLFFSSKSLLRTTVALLSIQPWITALYFCPSSLLFGRFKLFLCCCHFTVLSRIQSPPCFSYYFLYSCYQCSKMIFPVLVNTEDTASPLYSQAAATISSLVREGWMSSWEVKSASQVQGVEQWGGYEPGTCMTAILPRKGAKARASE